MPISKPSKKWGLFGRGKKKDVNRKDEGEEAVEGATTKMESQSLEITTVQVKRKLEQEPLGFLFETEDTPAGDTVITAVVDTVDRFSPASSGGLQEGDHILAIGDHPLDLMDNQALLSAIDDTMTVKFTVMRPAAPRGMRIKTTTLKRPAAGGSLGFVVATYDDGAVIVDDVVGGGVAEDAGVRKGHEILLINGTSVLGQVHDMVLKLLTQKGDIKLTYAYAVQDMIETVNSSVTDLTKYTCFNVDVLREEEEEGGVKGYGMMVCTYDTAVAEVLKVKEDGPAATAGVNAQDQIVAINGEGVDGQSGSTVHTMLANAHAQGVASLTVVRPVVSGDVQVISVSMVRARTNQSLGFVLASRENDVTVVDDVFTAGLAVEAGLRAEDRIITVNGNSIVGEDHDQIIGLLTAESSANLIVLRSLPLLSEEEDTLEAMTDMDKKAALAQVRNAVSNPALSVPARSARAASETQYTESVL